MVVLRFLIDTNTISEPVKFHPNASVVARLKQHTGEIALASVSWHELLYGLYRLPLSRKQQKLERYFWNTVKPRIPVLNYDEAAAQWFASERSRLARLGRTPSYADGQIAAIAKVNSLILVTRNISDYVNFAELSIENWFN